MVRWISTVLKVRFWASAFKILDKILVIRASSYEVPLFRLFQQEFFESEGQQFS